MTIRKDDGLPTISDVALRARVARSTVSRAFSRPEMISASTVERVKKAATALGYVPNYAARALSTGLHGNIAIIVPDIANPFFPPLIRAVQAGADAEGYSVFLGDSDEDAGRELKLADRFANQVEGFILASPRSAQQNIMDLNKRRPVVVINRDIADLPRVLIDPALGVKDAVAHLVDLGHRKMVYVSGPAVSWSDQQRRLALRHAAASHDIRIDTISAERPTFNAGLKVVSAVLHSGATAAITFDDFVAHGLLSGLAEHHIPVPKKFSVIGMDDVLGASTFPALTSVSGRCDEAGRIAIQLLIGAMQGKSSDICTVLRTHLAIRATTGQAFRRQ